MKRFLTMVAACLSAVSLWADTPRKIINCNFLRKEFAPDIECSALNTTVVRAYLFQGTNRFDGTGYDWSLRYSKSDSSDSMVTVSGTCSGVYADFPFLTNHLAKPVKNWYAAIVASSNDQVYTYSRGKIHVYKSPEVSTPKTLLTTVAINGAEYGPFSGSFAGWPFILKTASLGGDVTGLYSNLTVIKIRGYAVATNAPSDGNILAWSAANAQYEPGSTGAGDMLKSSYDTNDNGRVDISDAFIAWTNAGSIGANAVTAMVLNVGSTQALTRTNEILYLTLNTNFHTRSYVDSGLAQKVATNDANYLAALTNLTEGTGITITGSGRSRQVAIDPSVVTTNTGIQGSGGGVTVSGGLETNVYVLHTDTSSQTNLVGTGGIVMQILMVDTFGHVTNATTVDLDGRYYTETEIDAITNLLQTWIESNAAYTNEAHLAYGWGDHSTNQYLKGESNLAGEVTGPFTNTAIDKTGDWTGTLDGQEGAWYRQWSNILGNASVMLRDGSVVPVSNFNWNAQSITNIATIRFAEDDWLFSTNSDLVWKRGGVDEIVVTESNDVVRRAISNILVGVGLNVSDSNRIFTITVDSTNINPFVTSYSMIYAGAGAAKGVLPFGAAGTFLKCTGPNGAIAWSYLETIATNVYLDDIQGTFELGNFAVGSGSNLVEVTPNKARGYMGVGIGTNVQAYSVTLTLVATNIIAAILPNDGAGSGLDADKLDGFDSSAFIQAGEGIDRLGDVETNSVATGDVLVWNGSEFVPTNTVSVGATNAYTKAEADALHVAQSNNIMAYIDTQDAAVGLGATNYTDNAVAPLATTTFVNNVAADLGTHTNDTTNPHSVTKTQVGLPNVENVALSSWTGTTSIITVNPSVTNGLQKEIQTDSGQYTVTASSVTIPFNTTFSNAPVVVPYWKQLSSSNAGWSHFVSAVTTTNFDLGFTGPVDGYPTNDIVGWVVNGGGGAAFEPVRFSGRITNDYSIAGVGNFRVPFRVWNGKDTHSAWDNDNDRYVVAANGNYTVKTQIFFGDIAVDQLVVVWTWLVSDAGATTNKVLLRQYSTGTSPDFTVGRSFDWDAVVGDYIYTTAYTTDAGPNAEIRTQGNKDTYLDIKRTDLY